MDERVTAQAAQRSNALPVKSTAEIAIDGLIAAGIDTLYCLPGVQNDPFFDALWHRQSALKPIQSRHEQGAAYMATGAALATGKPQACCLVPGIGFLNGATAFATTYSTGAGDDPDLADCRWPRSAAAMARCTGGRPGVMRTITSRRINSAFEPQATGSAKQLVSGRRGRSGSRCRPTSGPTAPTAGLPEVEPRAAGRLAADQRRPRCWQKPSVCHCRRRRAGCVERVRELGERLRAPVCIPHGARMMDARHPLAAPGALRTSNGVQPTWCWRSAADGGAVPQLGSARTDGDRIDIDAEEMARIERPTLGIVGDARANVAALLEVLKPVGPRAVNADRGPGKLAAQVRGRCPTNWWVKARGAAGNVLVEG